MVGDFERFVGIDVSETVLEVCVLPDRRRGRFSTDSDGLAALLSWLDSTGSGLVVLEGTGGLERPAARLLEAAGFDVAVVNPRQIRDFARGLGWLARGWLARGWLAKTDRLDAEILARFAERARPQPRPIIDQLAARLQALVLRRRHLTSLINGEHNRLRRATDTAVRRSLEAHLGWLDAELQRLDALIGQTLAEQPKWRRQAHLLASVPGIGPVTVSAVIALLPELGKLDGKAVAALAGLAPMARDSGKLRSNRTIVGGRAMLRQALYMAALVASRHNPTLKAFYQRLLDAGKAKKLALTAVMRKLVVILNAMVRDNKTWQTTPTS